MSGQAIDDLHVRRRVAEGIVALVAVQLCFGLLPLFVKIATEGDEGFSPRAIVFWRIASSALLFLGVALVRPGLRGLLVRRADLPRLLLCGLLGVVVNQLMAMEGISRTTVVNAGLLMTTIPVFTYALALLVRQELFRVSRVGGIGLALVGVTILVLSRADGPDLHAMHFAGNLMIVVNCASYAGFLILARPLLRRYSPLVVMVWVHLLTLWCLPLLAVGQDLTPPEASRLQWGALAYALVFPALGHYLNAFALARVTASTTAVFIYLQPLVGVAAGILWYEERLLPATVLAAAMLLIGLGLVSRSASGSNGTRRTET